MRHKKEVFAKQRLRKTAACCDVTKDSIFSTIEPRCPIVGVLLTENISQIKPLTEKKIGGVLSIEK